MSKISQAINSIRFVGLGATIRTIQYAIYRDRIEKIAKLKTGSSVAIVQPGQLTKVKPKEDCLTLDFENNTLEIRVLKPDLFRITWFPGQLPLPYAINQFDWDAVSWHLSAETEFVELQTDSACIKVGNDASIQYFSSDGNLIRSEDPPSFLGNSCSHAAQLHPLECIYGMGLKATSLNLRGSTLSVWNTDPGGSYDPGDDPLYLNNPVYMGIHPNGSYLVFYENTYKSTFEISETINATFSDGALRYYFSLGTLEQLLANYSQLTGRPPLPPLWSLGYHQSKWGYKSEADVRQVAQSFINQEFVLDAIHLDIDYLNGYRVFTVDPDRFPDLNQLTDYLDQNNIKVVAILDPGVKVDPSYAVFCEGLENQMYSGSPDGSPARGLVWPGWCVFPDFSSPVVRDWWGEKYKILLDHGVTGFWHDMNEPAVFSAWGDVTLPKNTTHTGEGLGGDHNAIHNVYGLLMNKSGYEALRKQQPMRRPWILSRSGWAGSQRFAWNWTGDVNSTWEMLQQTIPTLLNLSLSGFYYSGSDIGGFSSHPSKELYIRWFQLAAYTPFFRLHNAVGLPPREPYQFDEETRSIIRQLLINRKKLLPYLYTLAYLASEFGRPLLRPMAWEAQDNPDFWEIQDQFMLGPALLVAPILKFGETIRNILLPPGGFYHFWNGDYYPDSGPIKVFAGIDEIPIFVKAGSIVPSNQEGKIHLKLYWPQGNLEDRFFSSSLYSDAGDGYGDFRYEEFVLEKSASEFVLSRKQSGSYAWPNGGIFLEFIGVDVRVFHTDGHRIYGDRQTFLIEKPFDQIIIKPT